MKIGTCNKRHAASQAPTITTRNRLGARSLTDRDMSDLRHRESQVGRNLFHHVAKPRRETVAGWPRHRSVDSADTGDTPGTRRHHDHPGPCRRLLRRCATKTMAGRSSRQMVRTSSASERRVISSRAANGSSNSRSLGRLARARASETRIAMPPDSWAGRAMTASARPTRSRAAAARSSASPARIGQVQRQANIGLGGEPRRQGRGLKDKRRRGRGEPASP